jgi:hypothetical protein
MDRVEDPEINPCILNLMIVGKVAEHKHGRKANGAGGTGSPYREV